MGETHIKDLERGTGLGLDGFRRLEDLLDGASGKFCWKYQDLGLGGGAWGDL